VADEADVTVPESKKLKLETNVSPNEPREPPSASTSSAEPTPAIDDDDPTPVENEPPTARPTKPRLADPSFKEMPYTMLSPDDPALATCM
jgi:multisite-specific tRNA:(cytosine-C5)-methyltransferase